MNRALLVGDEDDPPGALREQVHGLRPLRIASGAPLDELARHAPYDQIIVAEPTRAVAWAWVAHTRPGGLIWCVLNPTGYAGQAVALKASGLGGSGRFLATVPALAPELDDLPVRPRRSDREARHARSRLPLPLWEPGVPWFLATVTMPDGLVLGRVGDDLGQTVGLDLRTGDGSWCQVTAMDAGHRLVVEGGPVDLFAHLVRVHTDWRDAGSPGWERLRLTVTQTAHTIDVPGCDARWQLPE